VLGVRTGDDDQGGKATEVPEEVLELWRVHPLAGKQPCPHCDLHCSNDLFLCPLRGGGPFGYLISILGMGGFSRGQRLTMNKFQRSIERGKQRRTPRRGRTV